jgi:transcriptional regulator with XRE-family HTH domain
MRKTDSTSSGGESTEHSPKSGCVNGTEFVTAYNDITHAVLSSLHRIPALKGQDDKAIWRRLRDQYHKSETHIELIQALRKLIPQILEDDFARWAKKVFPPAVNEQWLASQEPHKRAALLIDAWCQRKAFPHSALAKRMQVSEAVLPGYLEGKQAISSAQIDALVEEFSSDPLFGKRYFRQVCKISNQAIKERLITAQEHRAAYYAKHPPKYTLPAGAPSADTVFESEQERIKQAGLLLAALRDWRGLSLVALAEKIGFSSSAIVNWEKGYDAIPGVILAKLHRELHISDEVMMCLTSWVRPELSRGYIQKKLEAKQIDFLALPALDPEWLDTQPLNNHAGLLIAAFRERGGLEQGVLEKKLQMSPKYLSRVESGARVISTDKLEKVREELSLNEGDYRRLVYARFPALNAQWLVTQPLYKQAGLLLEAARERAGLRQKDVAEKLNLKSPTNVTEWEKGNNAIPENHAEKIAEIFSSDPFFDAKAFILTCKFSSLCIASHGSSEGVNTYMGAAFPAHNRRVPAQENKTGEERFR